MGNRKVTQVANGSISQGSTDAINGGQLWEALQGLGGSSFDETLWNDRWENINNRYWHRRPAPTAPAAATRSCCRNCRPCRAREIAQDQYRGVGYRVGKRRAEQAAGYTQLIDELEAMLVECTGYDAVSLQPNSGLRCSSTNALKRDWSSGIPSSNGT